MKYLIASDLHGSEYFTDRLIEAFNREQADFLVLLGDIYYHGPRNPFPEVYSPKNVADKLNAIKDKLIVIKGNCDSQVDTLISEFDFVENCVLCSGGKSVFLTHGHVYNKDRMPKTNFNAIVYGHFHTGFIEKQGGVTVANAGSVSLPKDGTPNSYLTLEKGVLTLKKLNGDIIKESEL